MTTIRHAARVRLTGYALLLVAALPCAAFAQTQPQFRPPGGLPLSTPVGTARNSDGSPSVTLGTMQNGIETNSRNIAALEASSVSQGALATALVPYQTQAAADAEYATQSGLLAETTRAQNAEQANASAIASLQSTGATKDDLTSALVPYITQAAADGRYATPDAVSSAVQSETDRATAAEQKNAGDIAAIHSGYVTTGALGNALGGYVTGSALSSSLASYLTKSQAAQSYLPLSGGRTTGPLNGQLLFDGLVGSSTSGMTVALTTDNSGAANGANCLRVPPAGITGLTIIAAGVSSNGTDAVMQKFDGVAVFLANGTPMMSNMGSTSNYPSFGYPGSWSIMASVDVPTKCVVVTARAGGTGSWRWKAIIRQENLQP